MAPTQSPNVLVLEVTMRDGNMDNVVEVSAIGELSVLEVTMRDGNTSTYPRGAPKLTTVLEVTMRDGNQPNS